MDEIALVAELHRQVAFGAAILGGFAVTFLAAMLVAFAPDQRIGHWAIGSTVTAAVLLIVATVAQTLVLITVPQLSLSFDYDAWPAATLRAKWIGDLAFFLGIVVLFGGLGLSGWARDRLTGTITASAAAVGIMLAVIVIAPTF